MDLIKSIIILWGEKFQFSNNGLFDLFGLGIIGSMFNGGGFGSMPSTDFLKAKLDESDFEVVKDENKAQ